MENFPQEIKDHLYSLFLDGVFTPVSLPEIPRVDAYFDGIIWPHNPNGHTGYGIVIKKNNQTVFSGNGYVGVGEGMTVNVAETSGLLALMTQLMKLRLGGCDITVYGDSQTVINRMIKDSIDGCNGTFKPYIESALKMKTWFPAITFKWIPRELNTAADAESKKSILPIRQQLGD